MGPPDALRPLAEYNQWILWKSVPRKDGKTDKIPTDPATGRPVDPHNPQNWLTAADVYRLAGQLGVGFVFTDNDPFWFLDIDHCYTPELGWSPLATTLCQQLAGAAVEVSQSNTGLHLFGSGAVPEHSCRNAADGLEFYHTGRFVALSENPVTGDAGTNHDAALAKILPYYFPPRTGNGAPADWTDTPADNWRGPDDDAELVKRMLASVSAAGAFGGKASVKALWTGDADALAQAFPPTGEGEFDASAADAALCAHLAFWTGRNCERMDRLFRMSALYRGKWEREDYRTNTVTGAASLCQAVYGSRLADAESLIPPPPASQTAQAMVREGYQFLGIDQQLERFAGCVYVRDRHQVFIPDGDMLGNGQFRATFGGYTYPLDAENKKVTRNAWEAFTESQVITHPRAHSVCFRPEAPPGSIVAEEGRSLVNMYVPLPIRRVKGDVTPFLDLLARMLPHERDRTVLLSYMAACVQNIGQKFQWAPMVQGTEGNGKTVLVNCLSYAIGRRYTHRLQAHDLEENALKFNYWLEGKLLVGIDEIYLAKRRDVIEWLKEYITSDRKEIQPKGANQYMGDNRANFFFCSNHKDAVPISRNGRRYCILFCAQQSIDDLAASGMTGTYFPELYAWLRADGHAIVADYLQNYAIPEELNPAGVCQWAPTTESTAEALGLSMGGVEQEILEAVEQGRPGFAGGWVSSMALDRMLKDRGDSKKLPQNKRRELLAQLGYQPHPGLRRGRVNTYSTIDAGKPRLYITQGHLAANITGPQVILEAYTKAQDLTGAAAAFASTPEVKP